MRLLVCGRSSLRRKPIEAVFSAGNFLVPAKLEEQRRIGVGIPRARVRWVVLNERGQRRPGNTVTRAV